jgi:hypothetical protein
MNGSFRHEPLPVFGERLANIRDWWRRCVEVDAAGILVTSWEPNRLAIEMTTVVDAAAASLWNDPGVDDLPGMLAQGFARVSGPGGSRDLARQALACDSRAFVGNARWEINARWDTCATRRGVARFESERSFFGRLAQRGSELPAPFRASVAFRLYLAERDVYVRSSAAMVFSLRRKLRRHGAAAAAPGLRSLLERAQEFSAVVSSGRRAARALWRLTRDRRSMGPNERITTDDAKRLAALRRWVKRCIRSPRRLFSPSPVCGAWQLQFDVLLDEPALQRAVVEARAPGGGWRTLHARTQIEFRAEAARPRAGLRREMSVPVPGPGARIRIAVRGLGRLGISHVELTDGVQTLAPKGWAPASARTIGRAAPRRGFPKLNWERNAGSVTLDFGKKKRRP